MVRVTTGDVMRRRVRRDLDSTCVDILHVATVPMTLRFLRGLVAASQAGGYRVGVVTAPGDELAGFAREMGVAAWTASMTRRISPFRDLRALWQLVRIIRHAQPLVVHGHTPKGGLLGMLAARITGVPVRVYHLRGFPASGRKGLKAAVLRGAERMSCGIAQRVICVSHSLKACLEEERLCDPGKAVVLGLGSGQGVDARGRFNPERIGAAGRRDVRAELGLAQDAPVVGFVGRIVRDKGFEELARVWNRIVDAVPEARLLIAGPVENEDPVDPNLLEILRNSGSVHLCGMVSDTASLYAAMDIVALPSYREGFPNVALEAAAMRVPVVATRIPGCVDAVIDGITGTLVEVRNEEALLDGLLRYIRDPDLRHRHGEAARERVMREYRPEVIAESVLQEYRALGAPPGSRRYFQSGRWGYELGKRIFDIVIASLGCVVATPVLLITGLAVWWRMGRPVLFRQLRPGLHGRPFELLKFRTMRCEFDGEGLSLPDEERLTALGQFLRSTSLDELPALWNVLKGELSLVGPRPLLMEYLPLYTERQALRHCVKPGMTGWAQVGGRNSLAWEDKFELDLWYVENRSFRLDLAILIATVRHVWRREGISQPGSATAERFRGSQR